MRSKLVGLLIGLLTVAFVALGAVGGSLYWNRVVQRGQEIARAELPAVAAEQIPKVFGYDYQTVERSLTEIYPLLAPDFRQKFEQDATAKVIPEARKRQLVVQISIVASV
ncbi:Macrophage killing protein with similarity to conjugation protein [Mycolicibacterium conceptionense]|uniref:Macrophage killing protein with similarity to conjugation protein n=1 Tax=Mycolicibacterium conceptionense TaxID=451644 RepID=A0A0U1DWG1_9MYCO|nr:Macrophage killing protein with similarity to conjugation protein [Mycolicibacterium conceptionense]